MPVTRHRDAADIPEPRRAPSPLEGLAAACAAASHSHAFGHTSRPLRGVRRFRSIEQANAHRQHRDSPPDAANGPERSTGEPGTAHQGR